MRIIRINGSYTIASQLEVLKVRQVAEAGYRSIICVRPDGEGGAQAYFQDVALEAKNLGLKSWYLPLEEGEFAGRHIEAFTEAFEILPKPIFAYCQTGQRAAELWATWEAAMAQKDEEEDAEPRPRDLRKTGLRIGALENGGDGLGAMVSTRQAVQQLKTHEDYGFFF